MEYIHDGLTFDDHREQPERADLLFRQHFRREGSAGAVYKNKGPKNYRRSDERIHDELCQRLTAHPEIDATEIEVHVEGAEVTLRGRVENRQSKRQAEDLAAHIYGVHDVHNELRVAGK